jgi:DMSO reductase family type II enzyme chaperone
MAAETEIKTTSVDWSAQTNQPRRSVFGNYDQGRAGFQPAPRARQREQRVGFADGGRQDACPTLDPLPLQSRIDLAMARCFLYRFLAKAFEDPTPEGWQWLCDSNARAALASAAQVALQNNASQPDACVTLTPEQFDQFHSDYLAAFGHAARGTCPLNEIEYGDIKADPLFQPHRLADLAAFYRAFGLEVATDAAERHDHICVELEFMCVLAAREAYALEHQADNDSLQAGRDAQRKFLREHLGRWLPAFSRRLTDTIGRGALAAIANFTLDFVLAECARFNVATGSEDLLLRPADEDGNLCASCDLSQLPPGALASTTNEHP